MRVYVRPAPLRRAVAVDLEPTATIGELRARIGAEALYLSPPTGAPHAASGRGSTILAPLDDAALVAELVPPHATLTAAARPPPGPRVGPLPPSQESIKLVEASGPPAGAWNIKRLPTPLVTIAPGSIAAACGHQARPQLGWQVPRIGERKASLTIGTSTGEEAGEGSWAFDLLGLVLGEDWEELSPPEELDDTQAASEVGVWSLAGQIVRSAATHVSPLVLSHEHLSLSLPIVPRKGHSSRHALTHGSPTAEEEHNLAFPGIDSETLVFAWGDNALGQCLVGEACPVVPTPRRVELSCNCVSLCCGSDCSILVSRHGALLGGGLNAGGGMLTPAEGGGGSLYSPVSLDLSDLQTFSFGALAAGQEHVLAVTESGALLTWAATNASGQAGVGPDLAKAASVPPQLVAWPSRGVHAPPRVTAVACGDAHSLVLTDGGEVYAFGSNASGQLGLGERVDAASAPTLVGGRARGTPLRAIAAGAKHSLALTVSGAVFAWGSNEQGCLGLGMTSQYKVFGPTLVPGLPGPGRHIAAGGRHSAVIVRKGRLLLAGSNACGQLGHPRHTLPCSYEFAPLPPAHELCTRSAALGREHTLLLTYDGELRAFGHNSEGQCGVPGGPPSCESFVEAPARVALPSIAGRDCPLIVWAVAAGRDHNLVLCSPGPERHERLPREKFRNGGASSRPKHVSAAQFASGAASGGASWRRPLLDRRVTTDMTFGSLGLDSPSSSALDPDVAGLAGVGAACSSKAATIPAIAVPLRAKDDRPEDAAAEARPASKERSPTWVLLRPVVQPGVSPSCPFAALGVQRLAELLAEPGDEALRALCLVLARPAVLNASFCYPGLRSARLDAAGLCRALALACSRDDGAATARLVEAAAEGLAALSAGAIEDLTQRDQLRALAVYLCLPSRRPLVQQGARGPRSLLGGVAHLVMRMPTAGRAALRDLLADECGDVRVLRDFVVPQVRLLADDAIRTAGQQPWLAGALWEVVNQLQLQRPLWEAVLLLQLLASASEEAARLLRPIDTTASSSAGTMGPSFSVRETEPSFVFPAQGPVVHHSHGPFSSGSSSSSASSVSSGTRGLGLYARAGFGPGSTGTATATQGWQARAASLLDASAFQLTALAEGYVPPEVEFWLFQEHAQYRQITPSEVVNEPYWSDAASMLPHRFCSFMAHANLVPVAFKQRVLQVENVLRQRLSQEQVLWPQAEMVLGGGRADPSAFYFMLSVSRQDLLRETFAQMYSASPVDLRRPLRVEFVGEEAVDEGGVMREFFRVLSRELFSPEAGLFFEAEGSRRLWFSPTLGPGRQLEDYWMVGVIVALAVYNNCPGLDVPLPHVLFKKLKDEHTTQEDLAQLFPQHARSLEALLAWEPSKPADTEAGLADADAEFMDTFCLSYCLSPPSPASSASAAPSLGDSGRGGPPPRLPPEQPLVEGGADRPVRYRDRGHFAACAREYLLNRSVQAQFEFFARGFRRVCNSPLFDVLSPEELEAIVAGQTELDFTSLRQGAQYEGYSATEPFIDMFWQVLDGFANPRRRRFLAFCTGSDVAPAQGLQDLRLLVQRHGEEPTSRLPVAHTCFNLLLLPRYGSLEKLRTMLITAVEWTEGFGLQ